THGFVVCVALFFFFFQAEDGIRDFHVTGVQTCALPIYPGRVPAAGRATTTARPGRGCTACGRRRGRPGRRCAAPATRRAGAVERSEERRVGKGWRTRGWRWRWKRHGGRCRGARRRMHGM